MNGHKRSNIQPSLRAAIEAHYQTRSAVDEWSRYRLFAEERYLIGRYYMAGESVLDHACGAGRTTLLLHEMGMRVIGADVSSVAVQHLRRRFPYLHVQQGSFTAIGAPDESFDHALVSFNSLDHAYPETERSAALQELTRVLKPGGTLLFSSHNLKSLHLSPFYIYYFPGQKWWLPWMLRNTLNAFREQAYLMHDELPIFYASSEYVINQTVQYGFRLLDVVGVRSSRHLLFNKYWSPYLHYMFAKQ